MTRLGIVGPNGMPIEKRTGVKIRKCNFCGSELRPNDMSMVSSNGSAAICAPCVGRAIFHLKSTYGLVPDFDNFCWRKEEIEKPEGYNPKNITGMERE